MFLFASTKLSLKYHILCLLLQALQFQRSLDDIEEWLGSVEVEVTSDDYGRDLTSVSRLLQALQGVEEMVDAHMEKVQGLVDTAKDFSSQGNFLAENIQQRVWEVVNRLFFWFFLFVSLLI